MNVHLSALSLCSGILILIAGAVADGFNSVVGPIAGGAAAVGAVFAAYELSYRDEPDWARAAGVGGVVGAILGPSSCSSTRSSAASIGRVLMLRTFAFAAILGVVVGLPVVLFVDAVDLAAWVDQAIYFATIAGAGLATAHYDHQHRRHRRHAAPGTRLAE